MNKINQQLRVNVSRVSIHKSWILFITGIILVFSTCKDPEGLFEQYIVPNGRYYPGMAMNPVSYSGKNRIKIEWENGSDPKVTKARIFWNNYTDSIEVPVNAGMDVISKIIEPIEENDYTFMIRTYDDEGHVSVPVEVNGVVYGEIYESRLLNRTTKSAKYNELSGVLQVEWYDASLTEVGVQLEYTDIQNMSKTLQIDRMETLTNIPNFKNGEPLFVSTMHKPDSTVMDLLFAPRVNIPYTIRVPEWEDITSDAGLLNTQFPFTRGDMISGNRFYLASDWNTNPAAAANGNIDGSNGDRLTLWTYTGVSPVPSIENAKLFQTVELEAGTYKFEVVNWVFTPYGENCMVYVAAAFGHDLPDVENVGQDGTSFAALVPTALPYLPNRTDHLLSVEFVLTEKGFVTLGFVGHVSGNSQIFFNSIELYGLY